MGNLNVVLRDHKLLPRYSTEGRVCLPLFPPGSSVPPSPFPHGTVFPLQSPERPNPMASDSCIRSWNRAVIHPHRWYLTPIFFPRVLHPCGLPCCSQNLQASCRPVLSTLEELLSYSLTPTTLLALLAPTLQESSICEGLSLLYGHMHLLGLGNWV